jgi:hypothetical protein
VSQAPSDGYRCPAYARYPGVSSSLASPLSTFTNLRRLEFHCPCDLSSPLIHTALHQTSLKHLKLGYETRESVKVDDLFRLASWSTRLPLLEIVTLNIVYAEEGCSAEEVIAPRSNHFYSSWVLPEWPSNFPRDDLESLIGLTGDVDIRGDAVNALDIEDEYEGEKLEVERDLREFWDGVRQDQAKKEIAAKEKKKKRSKEDEKFGVIAGVLGGIISGAVWWFFM